MNIYVLIVVTQIGFSNGSGKHVYFQEFNSKETCEYVAKDLNKRIAIAYCARK